MAVSCDGEGRRESGQFAVQGQTCRRRAGPLATLSPVRRIVSACGGSVRRRAGGTMPGDPGGGTRGSAALAAVVEGPVDGTSGCIRRRHLRRAGVASFAGGLRSGRQGPPSPRDASGAAILRPRGGRALKSEHGEGDAGTGRVSPRHGKCAPGSRHGGKFPGNCPATSIVIVRRWNVRRLQICCGDGRRGTVRQPGADIQGSCNRRRRMFLYGGRPSIPLGPRRGGVRSAVFRAAAADIRRSPAQFSEWRRS